jgi:hypothetical protein
MRTAQNHSEQYGTRKKIICTSIFCRFSLDWNWPPLWSSGQSSWLQIQRPGFDSRHYLSPRANYTDRATPLVGKVSDNFEDRECRLVSVTDPYGHILGFLDRSCYFFFQVVFQLYSRGWVDPVPDPLFLRKCDSAGNRTRTSESVARSSGR